VPRAPAADPPAEPMVIHRDLPAPPALVFAMWTTEEHFARWFAPHTADIPFCRLDPRPGGVVHFCHRFAGGPTVWIRGAFDEVVAPERLVFTVGFVDEQGRPAAPPMVPQLPPDVRAETTVTLRAIAGGTRMTVSQRILSAEAAAIAEQSGERRDARAGWDEMFERLEDLLRAHLPAEGASPWPS
jgi:uncharacterized protein YndB with AHSA1/START domain